MLHLRKDKKVYKSNKEELAKKERLANRAKGLPNYFQEEGGVGELLARAKLDEKRHDAKFGSLSGRPRHSFEPPARVAAQQAAAAKKGAGKRATDGGARYGGGAVHAGGEWAREEDWNVTGEDVELDF